MNIVTYQSECAQYSYRWLAYIVLPNGKYWPVMFHGATEEEAKANAVNAWNAERSRSTYNPTPLAYKPFVDPWASAVGGSQPEKLASGLGRGSHLRGKVWMRHKETRDLIAVSLTEITMYEQRNYERSGPRSK